jgi:hypothetical protein
LDTTDVAESITFNPERLPLLGNFRKPVGGATGVLFARRSVDGIPLFK